MKEGMLWYDNLSNENVGERIMSAINFFESKYGFLPEKCYLNPKSMNGEFEVNSSVKVLKSKRVMVNHIWLEFPKE